MPVSPNTHTFFWGGWGGSLIVIDLDARMSWAYVMNKMGYLMADTRDWGIAQAIYAAL